MFKKFGIFGIIIFVISSLVVFSGCPTGGGGSNPPDDNTVKEAVKWTKVTQLERM